MTYFRILERHKQSIQPVFLRVDNSDALHTGDSSMKTVFANEVETLDGRRVGYAILASRLG